MATTTLISPITPLSLTEPSLTILPTPSPTPTAKAISPLLALPLEIRLQIYTHALALQTRTHSPLPKHAQIPLFAGRISTTLLLTSRQIYTEARLLPFQTNTFVFTKYYGSSVFTAREFLTSLAEWQQEALRKVEVWVVGREIVESWRREEGWDVVVGLLGSTQRCKVGVKVQDGDAWVWQKGSEGWVANGESKEGLGLDGWVRKYVEGNSGKGNLQFEFSWAGKKGEGKIGSNGLDLTD